MFFACRRYIYDDRYFLLFVLLKVDKGTNSMETLLGTLIRIVGLLIVGRCILLMFVWWVESLPFVYFYECPYCHKRLKYVYHKCPNCNRVHKNLFSNWMHIFHIRCKCGRILTTLSYLGRIEYEACCPKCMRTIGTEYEVFRPECRHKIDKKFYEGTQIFTFPLVGGTSSGKTTFLMSCIYVLTTNIAKKYKSTPMLHFKENQDYAKKMRRMFQNGVTPEKTNAGNPSWLCIDYRSILFNNKRIYLFDPPGELFTADYCQLKEQTYYDNISGLIFIVDPFALRGVKEERRRLGIKNSDSFPICEEDQEKCLQRLLIALETREKERSVNQRNLKKLPCAVVVTKADALNFNVDKKSIKEFFEQNLLLKKNTTSNFCRNWLLKQGEGNLVNTLEAEFSKCRYFFVSSLGRRTPETTGAFRPFGVEEPYRWFLSEAGIKDYTKELKFSTILIAVCLSLILGLSIVRSLPL